MYYIYDAQKNKALTLAQESATNTYNQCMGAPQIKQDPLAKAP